MLRSVLRMEHKTGDRMYHFFCDSDSPLGECHDALVAFKGFVVQKIQDADKPKEPVDECSQ